MKERDMSQEHKWVEQLKKGDKTAFENLYNAYIKYVYYLVYRQEGMTDNVEDILQEVFLRVYKDIKKLSDNEAFSSWLTGITLNVCRLKIREKNFKKNKGVVVNIEDIGEINLSIDDKYLPGEILEKAENKKIILGLMDQLPKKQREVLFLYYFQEMTGKEIAGSLGTSETSVKNALFKGRNNLKKSIEEKFSLTDNNYEKFLGAGLIMSELFQFQWESFAVPEGLNKVVLGNVLNRIKYGRYAKRAGSIAAVAIIVGGGVFAVNHFGGTVDRQRMDEEKPVVAIVESVGQTPTPEIIPALELPRAPENKQVSNNTPGVPLHQYAIDNVVVVDDERINTVSHYVVGAQEVVGADGSRYIAQSRHDVSNNVARSSRDSSNVKTSNVNGMSEDQVQGENNGVQLPRTGNFSIVHIGSAILGIVLCVAWSLKRRVMRGQHHGKKNV